MNRQDVCILENVRGESDSGYYSRYESNAEKFLADPAMAKALGMLAGKRPKIKEWVEEHIASPEKVLEILTEESGKEIQKNKQFDESVTQYETDKAEYQQKLDEYNKQMEVWNQTPAMVEWSKKQEEYEKAHQEYNRLRDEYYQTGKGQHPEVPRRQSWEDRQQPEGGRNNRVNLVIHATLATAAVGTGTAIAVRDTSTRSTCIRCATHSLRVRRFHPRLKPISSARTSVSIF